MKVFLSYSRRDAQFVDRLDHALSALGYDVWTDRGDIGGSEDDRWRRAVVRAIRDADVVVLVLSPNSTTSPSVERELTVAADNSKRVVPVLERACELPDGFQYELAGVQYVDFTAYDFDVGVSRLATQIGPALGAGPEVVSDPAPDPSVAVEPAPTSGERSRRNVAVVGGVLLLAVAVGGLAVALSGSGGGDADDQPVEPSSSEVGTTSSPSGQEEAEAVVAAWADATTRRDFAEAARIDPAHSPEYLEMLYGGADDPIRMISVEPYIAEATPDGSLWRLDGAAMALDYNPEPTVRTHVICSQWVVDVAAGTATWTEGTGEFFEGQQIPREEFAPTYEAVCT